jgi:hypothetical protein
MNAVLNFSCLSGPTGPSGPVPTEGQPQPWEGLPPSVSLRPHALDEALSQLWSYVPPCTCRWRSAPNDRLFCPRPGSTSPTSRSTARARQTTRYWRPAPSAGGHSVIEHRFQSKRAQRYIRLHLFPSTFRYILTLNDNHHGPRQVSSTRASSGSSPAPLAIGRGVL